MINCSIKVKHNFKNIKAIGNKLPQIAKEITEDVLKNIRGYAIKLEKGRNEDGILCELVDTSNMEVKGRVYASPNKFMSNGVSYLFFEYFGTGQYAEQEHIGKTKHFIESGFTEWLIPKKDGLNLNYPVITVKELPGMQFYLAHRSKSKSFYGGWSI